MIKSVANAAAAASVTPDRAISGARAASSERPLPLKLLRESGVARAARGDRRTAALHSEAPASCCVATPLAPCGEAVGPPDGLL